MTISYDVDDSVATITLQREEKLNALDYAMIDDLQRHLDAVAANDTIRAVLLTGTGDRTFSAGCEITEAAPLAVASERAVHEGLAWFLGRRPVASTGAGASPRDGA